MKNRTKTPTSKKHVGEYYADLDKASGLYCVFHTETTKAYASYSSAEEAQEAADKWNLA